MIQLSDFTPGQVVIVSDGRRSPTSRKATVKHIGRKYVTLEGNWQQKFYVGYEEDCLVEKSEYGASSFLYPTEEAYQRAMHRAELEMKLRNAFDWSNISKLTYEQLKQLDAIITNGIVK